MKNISKQLDKLYLEQERELEQAEFTLDAVRNESPIFTVCENQTLSEFLQGEKLMKFYESSPGTHRGFCGNCGSPIFSKFDDDKSCYGLPLGGLDSDPGIKPELHVYVSDKAPWHDIADRLPKFSEGV